MPDRPTARTNDMPRRRPKAKPTDPERRQYALSFPPAFAARIDRVAEQLSLDPTSLLRMVVKENFARYEKRADAVEQGDEPQD